MESTSTSTSIMTIVNDYLDFKVNGYSLTKGMGIGKYISFDVLTVGGFNGAIYFYPDGKSAEDNASYVSLFIALVGEGNDMRALFELSFVFNDGPYTLKYRGVCEDASEVVHNTVLDLKKFSSPLIECLHAAIADSSKIKIMELWN